MLRRQIITALFGGLIALLALTIRAVCDAHYPNIPSPSGYFVGVGAFVEQQEQLVDREIALYVLGQLTQEGVIWWVRGAMLALFALRVVAEISPENIDRLAALGRAIGKHRYFIAPLAGLGIGLSAAFLTHPQTFFLFLTWACDIQRCSFFMIRGLLVVFMIEQTTSIKRGASATISCWRTILLCVCGRFLFEFFPDLREPIPKQTYITMGFEALGLADVASSCSVNTQTLVIPRLCDSVLLIFLTCLYLETSRRIFVHHIAGRVFAFLSKQLSTKQITGTIFGIAVAILTIYLRIAAIGQSANAEAFLQKSNWETKSWLLDTTSP